jgi:hypothetical protein
VLGRRKVGARADLRKCFCLQQELRNDGVGERGEIAKIAKIAKIAGIGN